MTALVIGARHAVGIKNLKIEYSAAIALERLNAAAVCAQRLPVAPAGIWSGEKADDGGDILGRPEAFERRLLGHVLDDLGCLPPEENVGSGRPRRDSVDGDIAAAKFLGQYARHNFKRNRCSDFVLGRMEPYRRYRRRENR